ncbi:MAG: GNAT family N-acetyltransferase [Sphingobacterium sp.]|jgi:ribosomal protein S18 acetylase RimI-like enzyme|nr:GNAT family N-acetyltransferase [Sphingobacterium sp.]
MIKIIKASLRDIPAIQSLAAEIWPITFKDILSQEQISYMMDFMYSDHALTQQIEKQDHQFLLAQKEKNNIGYLSFELNYKSDTKTKIHKIYLLPATQGQGVGKRMFEEVTRIALQHGNNTLSLNVNRDNSAVDFYKRIGFHITGEENIAIGNGFLMEDYIMECPITQPL